MPPFRNGTKISYPHGRKRKDGKARKQKYLRVTAGPQRGKYVHDLIMEAVLGRELESDETVEHRDGNGLNVGMNADGRPNLIVVSKSINTRLRYLREKRDRAKEVGQGEIPWTNQF